MFAVKHSRDEAEVSCSKSDSGAVRTQAGFSDARCGEKPVQGLPVRHLSRRLVAGSGVADGGVKFGPLLELSLLS